MYRKDYIRKRKKEANKTKEQVLEVLINEESDYQDYEASDFDLSADEFIYEEFQEKNATSLLNIVTDNLDKDCSDTSDWDEDIDNSPIGKKMELLDDTIDKLEIVSSEEDINTQNMERKPSVGG